MTTLFAQVVKIKKFFFPTAYDKYLRKLYFDRKLFYSQFIKPGNLTFDIGANVGDRTKIFLELESKVISIEPQQSCCDILRKKFGNKIILLQKGVGSRNEVKDFFISNHNQLSTFSTDWIQTLKSERFKDSEWNESTKVEIVTLDSIIEKYGSPDFIKIDVEGFELEVLKGLTKKFKFLSFEFAVPDNLSNLNLCLDQLESTFKNLQFNYAVMDNTHLTLDKWVSYSEIKTIINSTDFIKNSAGDIYVKMV